MTKVVAASVSILLVSCGGLRLEKKEQTSPEQMSVSSETNSKSEDKSDSSNTNSKSNTDSRASSDVKHKDDIQSAESKTPIAPSGFVESGHDSPLSTRSTDEIRTTLSGAIFIRDTSNDKLGEAWKDPSGMIWGDIVKNEDGSPRLSYRTLDAHKYCVSIGASLPLHEDFIRLREYFGAEPGANRARNYIPQILPNLTSTVNGAAKGLIFRIWLYNAVNIDSYNIYFDGGSGETQGSDASNIDAYFRCVAGRPDSVVIGPGAPSVNQNSRTTASGKVFNLDTSNPKLGKAWKDPSGMIWGEPKRDEHQIPVWVTWTDADAYCKSMDARLPSKEDFIRLREYLGARSGLPYNQGEGYYPQILPGLKRGDVAPTYYWYWTAPDMAGDLYYFETEFGSLGRVRDGGPDRRIETTHRVRCVM